MPHVHPQPALFHGPGAFSATLGFLNDAGAEPLVEALRELGAHPWPHETWVLTAVRPSFVGVEAPLLPLEGPHGRFPSSQLDGFVQVAAPSREALLHALRQVVDRLRGIASLMEELDGGRIGVGREPFGFVDGVVVPTKEEVESLALVPDGVHAGASLILVLRFEQALERFARLRERAQDEVVGRTKEGALVPDAPPTAHVRRFHGVPWKHAGMIRRGFPYREEGKEGLCFVAAAKHVEPFRWSLEAMAGVRDGLGDWLLRYATAVGGGLYLALPSRPKSK